MKDTKEKKILEIESMEEAKEWRKIASGRRFFKVGERMIDIVNQEIERYQYEHSSWIYRFWHRSKFGQKNQRYMLESRIPRTIRAMTAYCMQQTEENEEVVLESQKLIKKIRKELLSIVREYEKREHETKNNRIIEIKRKVRKEA